MMENPCGPPHPDQPRLAGHAIVSDALDHAAASIFDAAGGAPLASAEELRAALTGPAMAAVCRMRIEQIVRHGHTTDNDETLPLLWLPKAVLQHAQIACDRIGVTGKDRNLPAAEKSLARTAALCLAALDRIRRERERTAP